MTIKKIKGWMDNKGRRFRHLWLVKEDIDKILSFSQGCFLFKFGKLTEHQLQSLTLYLQKENENGAFENFDGYKMSSWLCSNNIPFRLKYVYEKSFPFKVNMIFFQYIMDLKKNIFVAKFKFQLTKTFKKIILKILDLVEYIYYSLNKDKRSH